MSGISGIIYSGSGPDNIDPVSSIKILHSALQHRGSSVTPIVSTPNAAFQGRHHPNNIFQAHTFEGDGLITIVDGNITLPENTTPDFTANNPAELIAKIYRSEGVSAIDQIRESYSIAIYDTRTNEILLLRDFFAARPLYFAQQNGIFWISSEIKGIISDPNFERKVNSTQLSQELTFRSTFGPETLFQDVYKVPPGHCFHGCPSKQLQLTFNTNIPRVKAKKCKPENWDAKIWELLGKSIVSKTRSDTLRDLRVGTLLSGGIDSALLIKKQEELSFANRKALCCGFSDEDAKGIDETEVAQSVANSCDTQLESVPISSNDDILAALRRVVLAIEEPSRTVISVPIETALAKHHQEIDCLLTGVTADIIFGESSHYDMPIFGFRKRAPIFLTNLIRITLPIFKKIPKLGGYARWFERGDHETMRDYIASRERFNWQLSGLLPPFEKSKCALHIQQLSEKFKPFRGEIEYTITKIIMYSHGWNDLFDKLASHYSTEAAHPFQNRELFELALEMPYREKVSRRYLKPALRRLTAKLYSREFAYMEKKIFTSPTAVWLRDNEPLKNFAFSLESDTALIHQYLDSDAIKKVLARYREQLENNKLGEGLAQLVYTLINLEIWLETFFKHEKRTS